LLIAGGLAAVAIAAVVGVVALASGGGSGEPRPEYPYQVQTFEDIGRDHLAPGQTYERYNSNPPTTGAHAPAPAAWGMSDAALPKEVPVHNMEHGGVVIWYNCAAADLDDAACQQLRDQLTVVTEAALDDGKQVLTLPYLDMEYAIALTAWGVLDTLDAFDGPRIEAFIARYDRAFNPEGF
jgi:hypothetical protein